MVRRHMRFYPEDPSDGVVREVWHGERWRVDLKVDHLTPMCIHPTSGKHFYVKEVSKIQDGRFVIPIRWIIRNEELCADAHELVPTEDGLVSPPKHIVHQVLYSPFLQAPDINHVVSIRAVELVTNLPDLLEDQPQLATGRNTQLSVSAAY